MPEQIKGNPRRKPPERTSDHAAIDTWSRETMPAMQPLVKSVDEAILAAVPSVHFGVKFHRAFYGLPELGWIIELAAYFKSVNVLFLGGADFDHPPPLGSTGRTRYVKITNPEAGQAPEMRRWIEQAARTPGWT